MSHALENEWSVVDELLEKEEMHEAHQFVRWARSFLAEDDACTKAPELLDLAASVLEEGGTELLNSEDVSALFRILNGYTNEENPYPKFRAACALVHANHLLDLEGKGRVADALRSFILDDEEDVRTFARDYLTELRMTEDGELNTFDLSEYSFSEEEV